jgi:hypothetical protein
MRTATNLNTLWFPRALALGSGHGKHSRLSIHTAADTGKVKGHQRGVTTFAAPKEQAGVDLLRRDFILVRGLDLNYIAHTRILVLMISDFITHYLGRLPLHIS